MRIRQLFEAKQSVGFIFGRFNPPHKGHRAAWEMLSQNNVWYVGTNKSTQGPKDPLPYDIKIKAMEAIWPEVAKHITPSQSWLTLASEIYNKHGDVELKIYTDEEWVIKTINQYNGKEGAHGFYKFSKITPVATPRLSSATAVRAAVSAGDKKAFADAAGIPADTLVDGVPFFDLVAKYLGQYKKENKTNEDQHPNEKPRGPETKPTMPAGTVKVDVSDVYDWYKLGQHISDLDGLGKHDFGQGPPSAIISFGSEEEEHQYLKNLKKIGLNTTDIDPKDPNQPKGMPRQKTDPTYNTEMAEAFDTDVEWIKDMDNGGIQVFATKVDDAYIELTYKRMTNDDVYIAFSRGGRSSVTGEGNQNKIFGAVINHIQKWVNTNKPPRIVFSAFKPNTGAFGAQDTTRSSLYKKMVQRFASQNGYEYDVEDTGNEDTFILTKKQQPTQTNESLDQPYPYRWVDQEDYKWEAVAQLPRGLDLRIRFEKDRDNIWDIEFLLGRTLRATGEGDQYRIFATVVKAVTEWAKWLLSSKQPVKSIRFSAIKDDEQDTGRARLYNRFAKQLASGIGFDYENLEKGLITKFILSNPNYEKVKENVADGMVKYANPQFDAEWEEAERYPEFRKIGKEAWIELAKKGKAVTITSAKGINNTDAADPDSFKSLDAVKQGRALDQLKSGTVEMPIVAVYSDGWKELIGGNTRLTAMLAQNGRATVWAFKVPDEVAELAENFADGKNPGRKGLSKRMGVNTKASVSDLRKTAKSSSGEKQRMAHWLANMKSGQKKK